MVEAGSTLFCTIWRIAPWHLGKFGVVDFFLFRGDIYAIIFRLNVSQFHVKSFQKQNIQDCPSDKLSGYISWGRVKKPVFISTLYCWITRWIMATSGENQLNSEKAFKRSWPTNQDGEMLEVSQVGETLWFQPTWFIEHIPTHPGVSGVDSTCGGWLGRCRGNPGKFNPWSGRESKKRTMFSSQLLFFLHVDEDE